MKFLKSIFIGNYSKKKNYFTITVNSAGLGDQLFQLDRLYRIGNAMGFLFIYTPLQHNNPSLSNEDEENLFNEFNLGWNEDYYSYRKVWKLKHRTVQLEKLLKSTNIQSLQDLKDYFFRRYKTGNFFNFVFELEMYKQNNLSRGFINKIDEKFSFPFKQKYWMNKEKNNSENILICVHVRRGDINFIEMEDGQYFSFYFSSLTKTIEEINPKLSNKYVPTISFLNTIEEITLTLNKPLQIYVLTDGIDIAYKYSNEYYSKLGKYFSTPSQMLSFFQKRFDEEFNVFNQLENCEILCGAYDYEITKKSIYNIACADILITPPKSGFSRMISSLINEKKPKYIIAK